MGRSKKEILSILLTIVLMLMLSPYLVQAVSAKDIQRDQVKIKLIEYMLTESGEEDLWQDDKLIYPNADISKIPRVICYGKDCYIRVKMKFRETEQAGLLEEGIYGMSDSWEKKPDGYYYLKKPFKYGQAADIFKGIRISDELDEKEAGKKIYLDIEVEAAEEDISPDFESEQPWDNTVKYQTFNSENVDTSDPSMIELYTAAAVFSAAIILVYRLKKKAK